MISTLTSGPPSAGATGLAGPAGGTPGQGGQAGQGSAGAGFAALLAALVPGGTPDQVPAVVPVPGEPAAGTPGTAGVPVDAAGSDAGEPSSEEPVADEDVPDGSAPPQLTPFPAAVATALVPTAPVLPPGAAHNPAAAPAADTLLLGTATSGAAAGTTPLPAPSPRSSEPMTSHPTPADPTATPSGPTATTTATTPAATTAATGGGAPDARAAEPAPAQVAATTPTDPLAAGPSAAPVRTEAPSATADAVTRQVFTHVDRLVRAGDGTHRLTLRLDPGTLGEVRVHLSIQGQTVRVRLSGSTETGALLAQGSHDLRRLLEMTGAVDARVHVRGFESATSSTSYDAREPGSGHPGAGHHQDSGAGDGSGRYDPWVDHTSARTRGGSSAREGTPDGPVHTGPGPLDQARSQRPRALDVVA